MGGGKRWVSVGEVKMLARVICIVFYPDVVVVVAVIERNASGLTLALRAVLAEG